jgi:uncharacterized membrane protein (UPF0127 family)
MDTREAVVLVAALLGVLAVAVLLVFPPVTVVDPGPYQSATVTLSDENGTELTVVEARIADTKEKRRVGLMRTESLEDGSGMLFVHPRGGTYTYHMKNMSFDIDIVFVGADGTITVVHHAAAPGPDGASDTYTGTGKYVLEVPRGFTNRTGVEAGDRVEIPDALR